MLEQQLLSQKILLFFLFMHRSAFDYKKANHNSFLLDVFHPQATLLASPLSDRRNIAQIKNLLAYYARFNLRV